MGMLGHQRLLLQRNKVSKIYFLTSFAALRHGFSEPQMADNKQYHPYNNGYKTKMIFKGKGFRGINIGVNHISSTYTNQD